MNAAIFAQRGSDVGPKLAPARGGSSTRPVAQHKDEQHDEATTDAHHRHEAHPTRHAANGVLLFQRQRDSRQWFGHDWPPRCVGSGSPDPRKCTSPAVGVRQSPNSGLCRAVRRRPRRDTLAQVSSPASEDRVMRRLSVLASPLLLARIARPRNSRSSSRPFTGVPSVRPTTPAASLSSRACPATATCTTSPARTAASSRPRTAASRSSRSSTSRPSRRSAPSPSRRAIRTSSTSARARRIRGTMRRSATACTSPSTPASTGRTSGSRRATRSRAS